MNASLKVSGFVAGLSLVAQVAHADIRVEERIAMEGFGVMAMANMNGKSVTTVAGDRARVDSDLQMQSKLVRMFAKDVGPTARIIRLDEEKVYELDIKKKQYTESTFAEARAQFQQMQAQAAQAQSQSQAQSQPSPIDESQCEWLEPKVDVKRNGEKASIAGLSAERMTIVASQPCKDKKTGQICEMVLTLDEWLSSDSSGRDEELKFYQAYAQKLGLDMSSSKDVKQRAEALFGRYKGIWSEVATKMSDVKGYPVKTAFALGIGGEQCQAAQGGATGSAQNAGAPNAGDTQGAIATASGEAAGEAAAQKAGQSSLGGIAGQLGGKIASTLFKKKKETAPETPPAATTAATPPAPAAPSVINLMQLTSELISISHTPADSSAFAVPADFHKVAK